MSQQELARWQETTHILDSLRKLLGTEDILVGINNLYNERAQLQEDHAFLVDRLKGWTYNYQHGERWWKGGTVRIGVAL